MGSALSLAHLAAGQGLQDRLARLRRRQKTVDHLIETLEAYARERQPVHGSSRPGIRLRAGMHMSV